MAVPRYVPPPPPAALPAPPPWALGGRGWPPSLLDTRVVVTVVVAVFRGGGRCLAWTMVAEQVAEDMDMDDDEEEEVDAVAVAVAATLVVFGMFLFRLAISVVGLVVVCFPKLCSIIFKEGRHTKKDILEG